MNKSTKKSVRPIRKNNNLLKKVYHINKSIEKNNNPPKNALYPTENTKHKQIWQKNNNLIEKISNLLKTIHNTNKIIKKTTIYQKRYKKQTNPPERTIIY